MDHVWTFSHRILTHWSCWTTRSRWEDIDTRTFEAASELACLCQSTIPQCFCVFPSTDLLFLCMSGRTKQFAQRMCHIFPVESKTAEGNKHIIFGCLSTPKDTFKDLEAQLQCSSNVPNSVGTWCKMLLECLPPECLMYNWCLRHWCLMSIKCLKRRCLMSKKLFSLREQMSHVVQWYSLFRTYIYQWYLLRSSNVTSWI